MKTKKFIFKQRFSGLPKKTDFELVEEELPVLRDGEVLFKALFISVDPYMRPYSLRVPTGSTMFGAQVAKVVQSKHPEYQIGKLVVGQFGWTTYSICKPGNVKKPSGETAKPYLLPDLENYPSSYALGVLGMPGNTAWFGLTKILSPKAGDILVITSAAGAVGSLVGQMAKSLGLKVIGIAGRDDKINMLTNELKFDHAFNYKTTNLTEAIKTVAPDGIDCYFDNVGGTECVQIMSLMKSFGKVAVCGGISFYNEDISNPPLFPALEPTIISKQLTVQGFLVSRWRNLWFEGIYQNLKLLKEGKLIIKESIVNGFENIPETFIGLFLGHHTGKALVKI